MTGHLGVALSPRGSLSSLLSLSLLWSLLWVEGAGLRLHGVGMAGLGLRLCSLALSLPYLGSI
jgi:hypothetical protein